MPKLSRSRRHQRQLNLFCTGFEHSSLTTPRKVSEEDIQDHAKSESQTPEQRIELRPRLKRPTPTTCFLDARQQLSFTPKSKTSLVFNGIRDHDNLLDIRESPSGSPMWGHFVDEVDELDDVRSPAHIAQDSVPCVPSSSESSFLPGCTADDFLHLHRHEPYKRRRIRSPPRPLTESISWDSRGSADAAELPDFFLQDPSLPDAMARLTM